MRRRSAAHNRETLGTAEDYGYSEPKSRAVAFDWGRWATKPSDPVLDDESAAADSPSLPLAPPMVLGPPDLLAIEWAQEQVQAERATPTSPAEQLPEDLRPFLRPGDEGSAGYLRHLCIVRGAAASAARRRSFTNSRRS